MKKMGSQKMSWDVKIGGTLLSMPSELHMGVKDGQFELQGTLQTNQMNLTKLVGSINENVAEKYGTYLNNLTGLFPEQTNFIYGSGKCMLWTNSTRHQFGILWKKKDLVVLYRITVNENMSEENPGYYLFMAAKNLGI